MLLKKRMKSKPLDQSKNGSRSSDHWSISQRHSRYFENIYDISLIFHIYISDICQYFAENSNPCAREIYFRYFDEISTFFLYFAEISAIFPILCQFLDQPTIVSQYRIDTDRYSIYRLILMIFCSLRTYAVTYPISMIYETLKIMKLILVAFQILQLITRFQVHNLQVSNNVIQFFNNRGCLGQLA